MDTKENAGTGANENLSVNDFYNANRTCYYFSENKREDAWFVEVRLCNVDDLDDDRARAIAEEKHASDIWIFETPTLVSYFFHEDAAQEAFMNALDTYIDHVSSNLFDILRDDSTDPLGWMHENLSDEDRQVSPDEFAQILKEHLISGELYLPESVAQEIVARFRKGQTLRFVYMWESYRSGETVRIRTTLNLPPNWESAMRDILKAHGLSAGGSMSMNSMVKHLVEHIVYVHANEGDDI